MHLQLLALALAAAASPIYANSTPPCAAPSMNIYVAGAGAIHTLQWKDSKLTNTTSTPDCGSTTAVWLELDKANKLVYCLDESDGLITSFNTADDGALTKNAQADTTFAPVSSILFNEGDDRAIAVALFATNLNNPEKPDGGPGIVTLSAKADGSLTTIETFDLSDQPGSNVSTVGRQTEPHPHQVLLDPTGNFIVTPDLGSDLIRLFSIDKTTNKLSALESVATEPGSGPRHGIFWSPKGLTDFDKASPLFYIAIHELDNTLVTFKVSYPADGQIALEKVDSQTTFGPGAQVPATALASEVQISPDNKFLYAANRLDATFTYPDPTSNNGTQIPSDSIALFELKNEESAPVLNWVDKFAVGGTNPRHFSINKAGNLLGAALVSSSAAVLLKRDPNTGRLGEQAGRVDGLAGVTTFIFDE